MCMFSLHNGTCMYVLRVAVGHQTSWYAVHWGRACPAPSFPQVPLCRLRSHGLSSVHSGMTAGVILVQLMLGGHVGENLPDGDSL